MIVSTFAIAAVDRDSGEVGVAVERHAASRDKGPEWIDREIVVLLRSRNLELEATK